MARNGKIARLEGTVREELNQRLYDGEEGDELLAWLNGLPGVVAMLKEKFEGVPINKQSLSEWRLGGYREWERQQRAFAWSDDLKALAKGVEDEEALSDRLSTVMVIELGLAVNELLEVVKEPQERFDRLLALVLKLTGVRRVDHRREKLKMEREKWRHEAAARERAKGARLKDETYQRLIEPVKYESQLWQAKLSWGPSQAGQKVGEYMTAAKFGRPLPFSEKELECYLTIARAEDLVRNGNVKARPINAERGVRNVESGKGEAEQQRHEGAKVAVKTELEREGKREGEETGGAVANDQGAMGVSQTQPDLVRPENEVEQQRNEGAKGGIGQAARVLDLGKTGEREDEKRGGPANAEGGVRKAVLGGATNGKKPELAAMLKAWDEEVGRSIAALEGKLFGTGGAAPIGGS